MKRRILSTAFGLLSFVKSSRIKKRIPPRLLNQLKVYNYDLWLWLGSRLRRGPALNGPARKTILFYPDVPWESSMIYQVCLMLGYKISNNISRHFDLAVKWKASTFAHADPALAQLGETHPVLNLRCEDISKARVDEIFEQVFGYSIAVDPLTYLGKCVRKSNLNAEHDGQIVECPIRAREPGYVYQRLLENVPEEGWVEDIRVPILKDCIPFVFLYDRPVEVRFTSEITRIALARTSQVFSEEERRGILSFCARLGLDYGELDVLRDRRDGLIYIVDANPTPHGPPIRPGREREGLSRLAQAFAETLMVPSTTGPAFAGQTPYGP